MSGFDAASLRASLAEGIKALPLSLDDAQIDQMIAYLALLSKWNSVYNLTSIRDPKEMVKQHVLDSLSAAPAFKDAKNVLDVGAGGGLPGMILAITYPAIRISMIDTVSKKTAFLTQAKTELGLKNVTVHTGRVETLAVTEKFDVITSRAFSELCNFINWSGHLLAEGGQFIAMKGVAPDQEIERMPEGWQVQSLQALSVPGMDAERHLVFIKRQ
ncbi:16S rRNA (guanine(527)-N(7))-methyltransferase RsmG [Undibacterium sp. RTI2.1]|uniref:16S rRNA (guanine(527)-N(7))-methyltransferase RsmG n=1 Tax=unclassified Undibacterium TaxID=2630295 RepID=UPI002AB54C90|nr:MULTISPECIES: 16S rRNA (guanine(527)-N(7))-methyltransferase RsmG [unclassified Undibacterium]MDY7539706.1 16S rRNA (guanine(527)-N(7))-methyltransferase RsmG [Undibacterium sp. 5I1]MEB0030723.1 16S rRNA (guanine(527)-N(7))-methyltransferase RsmG [Undibacterium sp. RTI2.1]MEB0117158.1 16S rRNA (guanine(527)-N(7))-methyltransferase RsmG [Undibacterium sp. RTI2.2]MEB0230864.1 16S rRNA (guanine(527)-N(7))-methyltransferase RsmG [Undibacterium sp. 10I3]MEB0257481.1 16S rRNA (guanine(527)-N(7))-